MHFKRIAINKNYMKLFCFCLLFFTATLNTFSQTAKSSVKYSEDHAYSCVHDYFAFYKTDEHYEIIGLRRVSNNVFYVSIKTCSGPKEICYEEPNNGALLPKPKELFWSSRVLVLTVTSKTKYSIKNKNDY